MTDIELIGYCDNHCETPRALFSSTHVLRMIKLSNAYPWYSDIDPNNTPELVSWVSMHEEMKNLVELTRGNLHRELILLIKGETIE